LETPLVEESPKQRFVGLWPRANELPCHGLTGSGHTSGGPGSRRAGKAETSRVWRLAFTRSKASTPRPPTGVIVTHCPLTKGPPPKTSHLFCFRTAAPRSRRAPRPPPAGIPQKPSSVPSAETALSPRASAGRWSSPAEAAPPWTRRPTIADAPVASPTLRRNTVRDGPPTSHRRLRVSGYWISSSSQMQASQASGDPSTALHAT
jgi:hypothetical protein